MQNSRWAACGVVVAVLLAILSSGDARAQEPPSMGDATPASAGGDDARAASAAQAQDAAEIFQVRPDARMCPAPFCGGAFVSRVNMAETLCGDGESREACYVTQVDLDPVDLTDPQLSQLRGALGAGRVLLGGRIEQTFSPTWGLLAEFRASEVWRAATDTDVSGPIFRVRDNGVRCIAAPCFSYDLTTVNTADVTSVSDVSLTSVGATPEALAAATEALSTTGLLVTGSVGEQPGAGPAGEGRVFEATQIYLPVTRGATTPTTR